MTNSLKNHAEVAAAAHNVCAKVSVYEEIVDDLPTGKFVAAAEFFQDVAFVPEGNRTVSNIQNRRLIGISRGDAKRLFDSRKGRPGGQAYLSIQGARHALRAVGDTSEEAVAQLMKIARSGAFRAAAHDVADDASIIETQMRQKLREEIAALTAA